MQRIEIAGVVDRIGAIAGLSDGSYALRLVGHSDTLIVDGDHMTMAEKWSWGTTMALSKPGDSCTVTVLSKKPKFIIGFVNHDLS